MNDKTIIECLDALSEDEMIEKVIIPLYKKRFKGRFKDIEFSGKNKSEDQGIDITYYEISPDTKAKEYTGIQVKQGDINTSKTANGIAAISIQAQQAFSKGIPNVKDKNNYYIKTYVILTTGEIKAKARGQIVDQFKDKNFRFIDGDTLVDWIKGNFYTEFSKMFKMEEDEEPIDNETPLENITSYIMKESGQILEDIQDSMYTLSSWEQDIVRVLMKSDKDLTQFEIAKKLGQTMNNIQEELKNLLNQRLIDSDEEGFYMNYNVFGNWLHIVEIAEKRINQLDYHDKVDISDLIDELI